MHDSFTQKLRRLAVGAGLGLLALAAMAKAPNIVMIMTDDVAPMDISAIHRGIGAVNTPNIDRIAKEGLMISDFYAQPSCTAGRAAFITGQLPVRTGLTTVGTTIGVGKAINLPSLRTVHAVFPHTALQLAVSSSGLACYPVASSMVNSPRFAK